MAAGEALVRLDREQDVRRTAAVRDEHRPVACRLLGAARVLIELAAGHGRDGHGRPLLSLGNLRRGRPRTYFINNNRGMRAKLRAEHGIPIFKNIQGGVQTNMQWRHRKLLLLIFKYLDALI